MNALVSIDVTTLTPATVFAPGGVEGILTKIEAEVSAEVFTIDTPEGRERIKSVAYKVARSKTALDEMGKELVSGIKAQAAGIDADRRTVRDRLDALKERVRGPLTAWEKAEEARIANHEGTLAWLVEAMRFDQPPTADSIRERIAALHNEMNRDWQEFAVRAVAASADTLTVLETMLPAAEQAERDAAELAELRRLRAEREEADRKADAERIAAQQAAERQAYEERRERERAEKARQEQEAAVARAVERERQRAEQEKSAAIEAECRQHEQAARDAAQQKAAEEAAERKRQENKRHRAKVHGEIVNALAAIIGEYSDAAGPAATQAADSILYAIGAGNIPHVSITY